MQAVHLYIIIGVDMRNVNIVHDLNQIKMVLLIVSHSHNNYYVAISGIIILFVRAQVQNVDSPTVHVKANQ